MKNTLASLMLMLLCATASLAQTASPAAKESNDQICQRLFAVLKSGNADIDYKLLRISWADSRFRESDMTRSDESKKMRAALDAGNNEEALRLALQILDKDYFNLGAHLTAGLALRSLNKPEESQFHLNYFRGYMHSIFDNGDGKSMETAWTVIEVSEEYTALRTLGLQMKSQGLMHKNGHAYDVLTATDLKSGDERTIYFNIDIVWRHETEAFGGIDKK